MPHQNTVALFINHKQAEMAHINADQDGLAEYPQNQTRSDTAGFNGTESIRKTKLC